ncbi:HTH-type transcriptional repressor FabR [Zhongshania aliphaticivorans]|uniref:HTH-type transcriptional repressor FabR n=1 Tax=Zhongshania aliphaticivorans TaxID=1470434 RepID=A0A5S9PYS6_9GAMM|nr:TetR/AcrR family transcriptional regulator [Zhongshania aliphaticivorans]CAA0109934.1 HTH-type transcriptional repressor FabR [Zhongshania aliphaticivorans]CAA0117955.1 HTH-type transcriptional repressor FabR [Zhongshania aliphaticivorans]CAA0121755.1 HTH-type transcriptional repressor FabR [Zhongshania aliphaticivorans]
MSELNNENTRHQGPKSPQVSRRYRGSSGDQRRNERYEQLLNAGLNVIGSQGYAAASVRSICAEAGLTERYFYESFANREALLAEVYQTQTRFLKGRMLAAFERSERNTSAFSRAGLKAFYDTLYENPNVARLLLFEVLGVSDTIDLLYYEAMEEFAVLIRTLAESLGLADISEVPNQGMVYAGLVGAVLQIARRWALTNYSEPVDNVIESSLFLFVAATNYSATRS